MLCEYCVVKIVHSMYDTFLCYYWLIQIGCLRLFIVVCKLVMLVCVLLKAMVTHD